MTEMQKKMRELISKEALDRAFDARFPKEMQKKLRAAKIGKCSGAYVDRRLRGSA